MNGILTIEVWKQLIFGMLGTAGFALIFHVRYRFLPLVACGGFLCWLSYLWGLSLFGQDTYFLATLLSGFVTAAFAEVFARICKSPSTVFFLTSIIPLIPGRPLYYFMDAIVDGSQKRAAYYGMVAFLTALGIAVGMSMVWTICFFLRKVQGKGSRPQAR